MKPEDQDCYDRTPVCLSRFDSHMRDVISPLVTDSLIAEHRQRPNGPHRDDLARVLNYFQRAPAPGKYTLYAERPFASWCLPASVAKRRISSTMRSTKAKGQRRMRCFSAASPILASAHPQRHAPQLRKSE